MTQDDAWKLLRILNNSTLPAVLSTLAAHARRKAEEAETVGDTARARQMHRAARQLDALASALSRDGH